MKKSLIKSRNKIISILLCILLLFSSVLFSSCTTEIGDEIENQTTSFFNQYIDSFKVVYSESLTGDASYVKALLDPFFHNSLSVSSFGLAYYYGSANSGATNNPNWFPDSIRMLVVKNSVGNAELISNKAWNWTFSSNLTGNKINLLKPGTGDYIETYEAWKNKLWVSPLFTNSYSPSFTNMYVLALKIVMYEILLGYDTLTTFGPATSANIMAKEYSQEIADANEGLVAVVKTSGASSIVGEIFTDSNGVATLLEESLASTKLKTYIEKLKNDYISKTKYTGFTKANADRMITYILDEVIGASLVSHDYETYFGTANYRNYVQRVAEIIYSQTYDPNAGDFVYSYKVYKYNGVVKTTNLLGTITYDYVTANDGVAGAFSKKGFSATAATFLKNFDGEAFFEEVSTEGKEYNYPKECPKAEYQSILMIVQKDAVFGIEAGIGFNILAYNKDLEINLTVRYHHYDSTTGTGTLYEFDYGKITFDVEKKIYDTDEQKYGYESDFEVGVDMDAVPAASKGVSSDGYEMFIIPRVTKTEYIALGKSGEVNLGSGSASDEASYYKVIDSQNGYGGTTVINEKKMACSFYEIVFDVVKSPTDPVNVTDYYNFKVCVSPLII